MPRSCPVPHNYFDGAVAARYDRTVARMFEPAAVDPVVDFLAGLAGPGPVHFDVVDGRLDRRSIPFRYVWPAELDLMAELAGMRPVERWSGWTREPFTSDSRTLIGVWEKPRS